MDPSVGQKEVSLQTPWIWTLRQWYAFYCSKVFRLEDKGVSDTHDNDQLFTGGRGGLT